VSAIGPATVEELLLSEQQVSGIRESAVNGREWGGGRPAEPGTESSQAATRPDPVLDGAMGQAGGQHSVAKGSGGGSLVLRAGGS
jgi:hypothetical protein